MAVLLQTIPSTLIHSAQCMYMCVNVYVLFGCLVVLITFFSFPFVPLFLSLRVSLFHIRESCSQALCLRIIKSMWWWNFWEFMCSFIYDFNVERVHKMYNGKMFFALLCFSQLVWKLHNQKPVDKIECAQMTVDVPNEIRNTSTRPLRPLLLHTLWH